MGRWGKPRQAVLDVHPSTHPPIPLSFKCHDRDRADLRAAYSIGSANKTSKYSGVEYAVANDENSKDIRASALISYIVKEIRF
ncbi:MAG: hypothetical protein HC769_22575 [Cyanobacteria bacterium CRU_2_1]|nr:hypothetical protein [Cyanobacteria bacterium CRU_2_1]